MAKEWAVGQKSDDGGEEKADRSGQEGVGRAELASRSWQTGDGREGLADRSWQQ